MRDLPPPARAPLLIGGFAGLITGILAGLWRLGWPTPDLVAGAPHGVLMMCAFFGTLISLERAVAVGQAWAYLGPLAGAIASLALIVHWPALLVLTTLPICGIVLIAASLFAQRRHDALHTRILTLGAATWLIGVVIWHWQGSVDAAQWWWIGFLILTIAGERLELSRLVRVSRLMKRLFIAIVAGILAGLVWASAGHTVLLGAALMALALWLLSQDVARRNVHTLGLPRYIAVCLLSGYGWLLAGGALLLLEPQPGLAGWDSALHTLTVGFVFAMVFGHAPIIVPAVLRVKVPYHAGFYVPLISLHLSLALRAIGDLAGSPASRADGALGNALSIGLFLLIMLGTSIRARTRTTTS